MVQNNLVYLTFLKLCDHPHLPTPTQTQPIKCHTYPHPHKSSQESVTPTKVALTKNHLHPAKKSLSHPHLPTPSQKTSHSHNNQRQLKNVTYTHTHLKRSYSFWVTTQTHLNQERSHTPPIIYPKKFTCIHIYEKKLSKPRSSTCWISVILFEQMFIHPGFIHLYTYLYTPFPSTMAHSFCHHGPCFSMKCYWHSNQLHVDGN